MKRCISAIVMAVVLLVLMSSAVCAATVDTLRISADPVTAKAGETAIITLVVEENPGFAGIVFWPVIQDSKGEKVDWNWTLDMGNSELPFDVDAVSSILLSADDNCAETGILMDILIHIPQNAASGEYTVIFMVEDCLAWTPDWDFNEVPVDLPAVTVTVAASGTVDCTHSDTTAAEEKASTCTEGGYTAGVFCNVCQSYISGHAPISPAGHRYEVAETNATCTTAGQVTYTCAVCGDSYSDAVAQLGHSFTAYTSNGDATCTVDGTETAACDRCGQTDTRTEEGSALGHRFTAGSCSLCGAADPSYDPGGDGPALHIHTLEVLPAVAATCTELGLTEGQKCTTCGEILVAQEEIPALGHTEKSIPAVEPTCTESGLAEGKACSTCGETLVAQTEIPATGHSFGQWTVKTQPTDQSEGLEVRTCTACGEEETRSIGKLPAEPQNDTLVIVVIVPVALLGIALAVIALLKKKNT